MFEKNYKTMISIKNLSKTYRNGIKALDDLSLDIGVGMFGLLGPNGAGKSSLMRTIATLQEPDSGSIFYNDLDIVKDKMAFRKNLGYLPQEFGVYEKDSAEQLLDYFAVLKGISSKKDRNIIVEEVLHLTNLFESRKKRVSTYSGGMRQRFGIAQLLLNKPKVIIVDEPTAGLDPAERTRFLNVLRDIGSSNIVIFSTHLVDDVKELCSQMAIVNKGKVLVKERPTRALESLAGKIWTKKTTKEELSNLENQMEVLSSYYNEDNELNVKVFADQQPDGSFSTCNQTLEDYYFITLKK